jgi:UDP-N-acetyl-D-galactosamine dehydrogenase
MILAGRRINDNMPIYVAERVTQLMIKKRIHVKGARILMMGLTFKENCPDLRNSKAADVIRELKKFGARVDVYDPWIDPAEAMHEYGVKPIKKPAAGAYDAIVIAVAHKQFKDLGVDAIRAFGKKPHVLYDIKYVFPAHEVDGRL